MDEHCLQGGPTLRPADVLAHGVRAGKNQKRQHAADAPVAPRRRPAEELKGVERGVGRVGARAGAITNA